MVWVGLAGQGQEGSGMPCSLIHHLDCELECSSLERGDTPKQRPLLVNGMESQAFWLVDGSSQFWMVGCVELGFPLVFFLVEDSPTRHFLYFKCPKCLDDKTAWNLGGGLALMGDRLSA